MCCSIPGVDIVPLGSWQNAPKDAIILGLKDLPLAHTPIVHQHVFFAHAYKHQIGAEQLLQRFHKGGGCILDIEFMTDEKGCRSVAVFSPVAGATGMALGVAAWCYQHLGRAMPGIKPFESEKEMVEEVMPLLKEVSNKKGVSEIYPTVLVMGALGRCGHGALDIARKLGIPESNQIKWDLEETKGGGPFPQILKYDIFVNCILLSKKIPPFLTREMLDTDERNLSLVVDVSCDVNNPDNPLPFYDSATTPQNPVRAVDLSKSSKTLEILSIDFLPSLLPRESSIRFADKMTPYLKRLTKDDPDPVWIRTKKVFEQKVQELCS
ncbi:saccharopine dehydrogenase [NAD(+), L-lysine-forming]-like [Actinia tenebrosa]|uniref:Saccharopine dehydrogenase [NAD(+), L-lysine-forming] n=1 Tax=Actinia tenebrosa TaxID=6105 RepID=A0A6P8IGB1_ACTTE|nr:saccharopine dehydrogenase [NAD(+), L-lysine-forming]-like [Actinia tenebrosa]